MDARSDAGADRELVSIGSQLRDRLAPVVDAIRRRFEVDTRALAALRIALGLVLLVDLVHRAGDLGLFYTDAGVYPRSAYEATYLQYNGLSLHALSGELWFQQLLFAIAGLLALAFALGYRTRLVGALSLVLLFSLHARNPAVLNGGDRLLRVLLFVSLVTPLGERWSLDALGRGSARSRVAGFGTAALLAQPLAVFTTNAIEKHRGDTWYAGEALEIAMHNDVMTVHLGDVLAEHASLLTVLNYGWVVLLAGSIAFLLVPVGRLRALAALAYLAGFAGMAATLAVGLFPLVLAAAVIPFLTTPVWDALDRGIPAAWRQRAPSARALAWLAPAPIGRRLAGWLRGAGRGSAASRTAAWARRSGTLAGFVVLAWILVFSASSVSGVDVPDAIDNTHVDQQRWALYAPNPSTSYSWYVVEAHLAEGTSIDALEGGDVDFEPPPDASAAYETFRHRKFMESVRSSGQGDPGVIATSYAAWACDRAHEQAHTAVEQVTVHRLKRASPVDGELEEPLRITVVEHACLSL